VAVCHMSPGLRRLGIKERSKGVSMKSSPTTPDLFSVVQSYSRMGIEDYQRSYSWEKEQIQDFFDDLKACVVSGDTHFFGTLILQEDNRSSDAVTVVDGQQRLTTTFVLVAALRDSISKLASQTIEPQKANLRPINVMEKCWNFLCPTEDLEVHRFVSSRYLRDYMDHSVLAEPNKQKTPPKNLGSVSLSLRKAVRQIRTLVEDDLENYADELDKLKRVNALLEALYEKFLVLRVTTNSLSESLDIFLTLNNRGQPLGASDLVRGVVMKIRGQGKSNEEQVKIQKQILEEWQIIAENVREPEAFLRHYLVSTSAEKIQKKKILDIVIKSIEHPDVESSQSATEIFWQKLIAASVIYSDIRKPTMGGDCQYNIELLEGLSKSHRIILLAVLAQELETSVRDEVVRLVFVLAFRWAMAGLNAQRLEDLYQNLCASLRDVGSINSVIEELRTTADSIDLNVTRFFSNDADSAFVTRALLHAVNKATTKGALTIPLEPKQLHLEHIAPQSESREWLEELYGLDIDKYSDYDSLISSVGNLTLLDKGLNLQAQKSPFPLKKKEYKKSTMAITRDLLEIEKWDKETLNLRTQWLVSMFDQIWSTKTSKPKILSFTEWYQNQ
jgi:hypothetical protein